MPKVSQDHMETQRLRILTAAFICFGRKGIHETTMREICKEAEMSPGAVYNYFDGKKAIIHAIAEKSRESADQLFPSVEESDSALQVLRDILMKMSQHIEHPECSRGHELHIRLWGEILKDSDLKKPFEENFRGLAGQLSDLIERAMKNNQLDPDLDKIKLSHTIIAFYQGMVLQKALIPDTDTTSVFETFLDLIERQHTR